MSSAGVVVPIRAFADGKSRLSPYLSAVDRARLLEAMADRVVAATKSHGVVVVSSAPEVRAWAAAHGVDVVDDPGTLDLAADAGRRHWREHGAERIAVVHADLPLIEGVDTLLAPGAGAVAVVVPCHREDGTPALSVPAGADFRFAFGPGSFARHVAEARRAGLDVVELRDDVTLRQDVDDVEDLELLARLPS